MPGCPYVCPFDQTRTPPVCQLKQFLCDVREGGSDRVGEDRLIKTRHEGKWCLASSDSWFIPKSFFSPIFKIFPLSLRLFKCTEAVFTVNHIWGPQITAWTDYPDVLLLETKHYHLWVMLMLLLRKFRHLLTWIVGLIVFFLLDMGNVSWWPQLRWSPVNGSSSWVVVEVNDCHI